MRGANPEQLDTLAARFEQSADRLDGSLREISHLVVAADWQGHDFDEFCHSFRGDVSMRIGRHASLLRSQAASLRSQAGEQRQASEDGFGSAPGAAGAALGAAGAGAAVRAAHDSLHGELANGVVRINECRAEDAPASSMAGYMEKLTKLEPGELQIVRIDGDPPRFVVLMKGIDGFEPSNWDSQHRTDLQGAAFEKFGSRHGPWAEAVKTALADAMKDDIAAGRTPEVMLMGHSGGGIAAANLAADPSFNAALGGDYKVTDVVIAGSGVVEKLDTIPGQTNVLMLHHSTDFVANAIQNPDTAPSALRGDIGGTAMAGVDGKGLAITEAAALTHGGSHQVDVFNSGLRWDRGAQLGGLTGHDQIYYTDELKHLSANNNSLVQGMEHRYASGAGGHSYYYKLYD